MLVEINLLSQKEKKQQGFLYVVIALIVLTLAIGVFLFVKSQGVQTSITTTETTITQTQQLREIQSEKLANFEESNSFEVLTQAVEWAETYPVDTVPILNDLIAQLPERGFFQTFQYSEAGTVSISVQFDTSREAAFYLDRLKSVDWISESELTTITTEEVTEEISSDQDSDVLPRYIAQYTLTLDKAVLKQPTTEEDSNAEGGE